MIISFDSHLAKEYGLNEAIFLNNLIYWIRNYQDMPECQFEGKTGMYHTYQKLSENLFTFWSWDQIKRIVDSLRFQGVIYTRPYKNNKGLWFYLVDEGRFMTRSYPQSEAKSPSKIIIEEPSEAKSPSWTPPSEAISPSCELDTYNIKTINNIKNNKMVSSSQSEQLTVDSFFSKKDCKELSRDEMQKLGNDIQKHYEQDEDGRLEERAETCPPLIQAIAILAVFNAELRMNNRFVMPHLNKILALLKDGHSFQTIIRVIHTKGKEFREDPTMKKYARPKTIFGKENFENYAGLLPKVRAQ